MRIQIKVRDTISSLEVSADCSLRDVYEMAGVSQDMSVRVNGISVATEDLDKPLKELGVQEDDRIEFSSPKRQYISSIGVRTPIQLASSISKNPTPTKAKYRCPIFLKLLIPFLLCSTLYIIN